MLACIKTYALAFALSAVLAGGASAQAGRPTGSNISHALPATIPQDGRLKPAEKARVTLFAFARCEAGRHRPRVEKILAAPALIEDTAKAYRGLIAGGECLEYGEIKMNSILLRGALFAALYRIDFASAVSSAPAAPLDWSKDLPDPTSQPGQQYVILRKIADCAVRADPADARAAILAPPVSPPESQAFARLAPHLNDCIPAGQTLTFSKTVLSGLLAEVLFRNGHAAG